MVIESTDIEYQPQPSVALYTIPSIALASFLGGPIAAGWLVSENYRRLNEPRAARTALINGIVATVALVTMMAALPPRWASQLAGIIIPAIYTALIWILAERLQGRPLAAHFARGGRRHSPWRAVGISLIAALPVALIYLAAIMVVPTAPPFGFAGEPSPYGTDGDVIFHTDDIPSTLVEEAAAALTSAGTLANGRPDAVELRLDGNGYVLTVPIPLSSWSDHGLIKQLGKIEKQLTESNAFRPVRVEIIHLGVSGIQRRFIDVGHSDGPG